MKAIPFNIKYRPEIESGEVRIITRIGQSVEIASYNIYSEKGDKFPILALVWGDDNKQHPEYYTLNGRFFDGAESNMDLYIIAKEVDLENELKEDWLFADKTEVDCFECMCLTEDMFVSLAKKYFELGLKIQKGDR